MPQGKFRFNTRELEVKVQREIQRSPERAKRAMDAVGGFINGEAKDRSPVKEGFLTSDISNQTVKYEKSYAAVIYIPSNAPSAPYAIKMHEGKYNLGPDSEAKARKTGKGVGNKFITRAIDANRDDIKEIIKYELRV
jgi:hypothetical protein